MAYLHINSPTVVHESIEGEVVIVNLEKGLYFSIDGVGAAVWSRIVAAQPVDDLRGWFADAYTSANTSDLEAFFTQLRENDLVTERADAPSAGSEPPADAPDPYAPPTLEVYSDMEELLLLDPIHEVSDEAGWPTAKP
jgi:hypothetical protein